jgi:hypothetical protein
MSESQSASANGSNLIGKISAAMALLAGIFYASGYMVIFTASERLGITDTGGDIFKAKYIQVGAYCVVLIVFLGTIGYCLSYTCDPQRVSPSDPDKMVPPDPKRLTVLVLFLFGLLLHSILVPTDTSSVSALVLMSAMIAYLGVALFTGIFRCLERWPWLSWILITILLLLAFVFVVACFTAAFYPGSGWNFVWIAIGKQSPRLHPYVAARPNLHRHIQEGLGVVLFTLLCVFLGRVVYLWHHLYFPQAKAVRRVWQGSLLSLLAFGTFDAVIGFAVVIYPFIPSGKGGGNYHDAPQVTINMTKSDNDSDSNQRYVILLETNAYLYVARVPDPNQNNWGKLGSQPPPDIMQIPQNGVSTVDAFPRRLGQ